MKLHPVPTLLATIALLGAGAVPAAVAAEPRETAATTAAPAPAVPAQQDQQDGHVVAAGKKVVGYFTEWGVYDRNYHVKNIKTSGSAAKLTNIVYAFGNTTGGRCTMGDAYAAPSSDWEGK